MKTRKIVSVFLALVMAISSVVCVNMIAFADEIIWNYDASSATLTISGTGEIADYTENTLKDRPWSEYADSTKNLVIEKGITRIGDYAFSRFSSLSSVELPEESLVSIGNTALSGNSKLKEITIPESVTDIGAYAFGFGYDMTSAGFVAHCTLQSAAQKYCLKNYVIFDVPMTDCTANAHITYGNEQVMWSFVAPESGVLTFSSYGTPKNKDTLGLIYDAENYTYSNTFSVMKKTVLIYDDDSADGVNFKVVYTVQKGKRYYLSAKFKDSTRYDGSSSYENGLFGVKYSFVPFDMTAYNNAVERSDSIINDTDKYTSDSLAEYKSAVTAAKKDSFSSQTEIDTATSTIISAESLLVVEKGTIKFIVENEDEIISTENISFSYGDVVTMDAGSDKVLKWIVNTKNDTVSTKVNVTSQTYDMVATEDAVVEVYLQKEVAETTYSKVTFYGKNNCIVAIRYLAQGETLDTSTVSRPTIPFYTASQWDKSTVEGTGEDISVRASYSFIDNDEDRCSVYYNGELVKSYAYDSYVYISKAAGKTSLALASDSAGTDILTYISTPEFYAPHRSEIYVVEVESQKPSIAITGSYNTTLDDGRRQATFNCKFFVPEGATVIEYGLTASSGVNSTKVRAESCSDRNEYSVKVTLKSTSTVTSITGKAYLTYSLNGTITTIESAEITQAV